MNAVSFPTQAAVSPLGAPPTASAPPAAASTLLPPQNTDGIQDAMTELYACLAKLGETNSEIAQGSVKANIGRKEAAEKAHEEALQKAKEESEKGGLFHSIAKHLGVAGVIGLCTFNYALVAADFAAHETGLMKNVKIDVADAAIAAVGSPELLVAEFILRKSELTPDSIKDALGKALPGITDEQVKPIVEKAIMANMMVLGAATSLVTAGSTTALVVAAVGVACSVGGQVVQELGGPKGLAIGLGIGGAVLSGGSALIGSAPAAVEQGAALVNAGTTAANGADKIVSTIHEHAADEAQINAEELQHSITKLQRMIDTIIDGVKEMHESTKNASATANDALQTYNQSLTAASSKA